MSDDFVRLVSTANPAYQQTSNGYPPSSANSPYSNNYPTQSPQLLDPFFDDEDEYNTPQQSSHNVPDSAFGSFPPMQSKESNIHLTSAAAPPAGTSKLSLSNGTPQGWTFDDDEPVPSRPEPPIKKRGLTDRLRGAKFKWPWQKEVVLTGERLVALNLPEANAEFISNYVSTSKYNMATFLPKFLFGALPFILFTDVANTARRAILEIRQPVLPLHRLYSTNTGRITHEPMDNYCSALRCSPGFSV